MGEPSIDSLHDVYEEQLGAARYKAERDAAVQELKAMRERNIELWMESGMANELVTCTEQKAERLGRLVWRLQNRLARSHRREKQLRKGMREWREKAIDKPQVTMSAYDLLPQEDRDAIAWVKEHGGLDSVKKLLDWVVGHCSTKQQLDFDFWLSGRVMYELGFDEDMADRDEVERRLVARLMPEGYEWPRYESGEPLRYEDRYVYDGREREVWHIDFDSYGEPTILNKDGTRFHPDKGERVERPAPKVLDADGVEIRVGDEVWTTRDLDKFIVTNPNNGEFLSVSCKGDDGEDYCCYPTDLTHRAPVLAADGRPLRAGEMVYHIESGDEFTVMGVDAESGDAHVRWGYDFEDKSGSIAAKLLTHQRPDSWERIEEDAGCTATKYNERRGTIFTTKQQVARDLVRRCRALAERERGE